ncbi:hypothetical protein DRQ36_03890 [bacterium]|nr:MAG: hypothetical protein DRQ36_03890 [bacterium]
MKKLLFVVGLLALVSYVFAQTDTLFFEDFEGTFEWEASDLYWYDDTDTYWHADTFMSYDSISYWCGTLDVGGTGYNGYNDGWLQYMDMPEVAIPGSPIGTPLLTFMHKLYCEPGGPAEYPYGYDAWDCAAVLVSDDGGGSWSPLTPSSPAYQCESSWAFGFCGLGTGYPGWWGEHPSGGVGYEPVICDLSAFAGDNIIIRFAFASDMMFSTGPTHDPTSYDPAMFGWLVDEIAITDSMDTLLYDDGSGTPTFDQGRVLRTWQHTDTEAYSGAKSAMSKAYCESYASLISPMIHIPDTFAGNIYFYHKCEYTDSDPDSDGYLDDFFQVHIIDSTADTTVWIISNYYRPDICDTVWRKQTEAALYGDMTNSMRQFAGHDIRIMFISRADGLPDSSKHLYIDDVVVCGRYALLHDVALTKAAAGPLNLGEYGRFTIEVANEGMSTESMVQVYGTLTYPDASESTLTLWPRPTIDGGAVSTVFATKMLNLQGDYTIKAWTDLSTDLDNSNDTIVATFTVPGPNVRELGWDDGVNDDASGVKYIGGGLDVGNAIGNFLRDSALDDMELTHIKFFTIYNGPAQILVLNHNLELPSGGDILYNESHTIVSDSIDGSWVTIDLSTSPVALPDTMFYVFIGTSVADKMPVVGVDITSPVDRWGWAILGTDTLFLREDAGEPYNALDLMIRAIITGVSGIDDQNPGLPKELALRDNYPNPFNPATSIEFDLPKDGVVELAVYDVLGKRVTTLLDDNMKAGTHRIIWSGRNDRGQELPSGVYLYRLTAGEKTISKKMILVK